MEDMTSASRRYISFSLRVLAERKLDEKEGIRPGLNEDVWLIYSRPPRLISPTLEMKIATESLCMRILIIILADEDVEFRGRNWTFDEGV